mgnify:CR=1 FL=1
MDADVSGGRPRKLAPEEDDPEFWETIGGRRVPIKGADKGGDDAEVEARFADSMVLYKYALAAAQPDEEPKALCIVLLIGYSGAGSRRASAVRRWT